MKKKKLGQLGTRLCFSFDITAGLFVHVCAPTKIALLNTSMNGLNLHVAPHVHVQLVLSILPINNWLC